MREGIGEKGHQLFYEEDDDEEENGECNVNIDDNMGSIEGNGSEADIPSPCESWNIESGDEFLNNESDSF